MEYLVSYKVCMRIDTDEEDFDITDKGELAKWLADTMYQWLQDGGNPHPPNIEVEKF